MDDLGTHKVIGRYWKTREEVVNLKQQASNLKQQGYKSINILLVERVLDDLLEKLGADNGNN